MRWSLFCATLYGFVLASPSPDQPLNLRQRTQLQQERATEYYTFVVAGDNRNGNAVLEQIFKRAKDFRPRFMVHTGDFVPEGHKAEYLQFLNLLKQAPFPVLTAIGNHEIYHQGRRWYSTFFGPGDFFMDYGPDRFLA